MEFLGKVSHPNITKLTNAAAWSYGHTLTTHKKFYQASKRSSWMPSSGHFFLLFSKTRNHLQLHKVKACLHTSLGRLTENDNDPVTYPEAPGKWDRWRVSVDTTDTRCDHSGTAWWEARRNQNTLGTQSSWPGLNCSPQALWKTIRLAIVSNYVQIVEKFFNLHGRAKLQKRHCVRHSSN